MAFFLHIGPKPVNHSVDRINNLRGYEPGNVRWATRCQQARNSSNCKLDPIDLQWIRFWFSKGYGNRTVSKPFGITRGWAERIRTGKVWTED